MSTGLFLTLLLLLGFLCQWAAWRLRPADGLGLDHLDIGNLRQIPAANQQRREEQQDQPQRAVGADARILHDLQRPLAADRAAQRIAGVGPAVFVKATGEPDREGHGQQHGHERRPEGRRGRERQRAGRPHQRTDQRKVALAGLQPIGVVAHPGGHGHPREELQGDEEQADFVDQETHGGRRPCGSDGLMGGRPFSTPQTVRRPCRNH